MNPDSNDTPGLGLPSPSIPQDNSAQAGPAQMPLQAAPVQDMAADGDALDEEWVNKARAIIEQTKSDPYLESRELSKVKADFLKNRHNRDIKLNEEHN